MSAQVVTDNRLWIAYADSGPGMLVPGRTIDEAREVMAAHPVFKHSACGIALFDTASQKEQKAARERGWFTAQTEVIPTFYARYTDPNSPIYVKEGPPKPKKEDVK